MRRCWPSAARVVTLLSFALLSSQSLLLVNALKTGSDVVDIPKPSNPGPGSPADTPVPTTTESSDPPSPTTTSASPAVTSPPATPSTTPSSSPPSSTNTPPSTSSPARTTSSTPTSSSFPTPTNPPPAALVPSTTSTSSSSTSSSSSSSFSSTSSSSPIIATTSSSGVTLVSKTGTTLVATATNNALLTDGAATSYTWSVSASSTATGAAASSSSKSFFDNKGAVAGTFAVVGAVLIGIIIFAIIQAKRRAARLQDEEDMTYFEKYESTPASVNVSAVNDGPRTPTELEMSYPDHSSAREMDVNDEPLATHAAPGAYPDRATHFGLPSMEEYAQPQNMGLDFSSGVDYPPGTSYDPAQYIGYEGYNSAQYAGYEGTYAQPQQPHYAASYPIQATQAHPYANPTNSPRVPGAPPVQFYGEAS